MDYTPAPDRYETMSYRRCGKSGLMLPALSLGLWHNFGDITPFGTQQSILRKAFDLGITHFDLANNYGPPYGDHGSRKYLISSLDQSLKRMHLDYVDIFYHHRPDPDTPIEETMGTLDQIVRSGKALYVGISNYYDPQQAKTAIETLKKLGTPMLIHQPRYSMLSRVPEQGLFDVLREQGVGCIAFTPLCNGILTGKYLNGIAPDSRAGHDPRYLKPGMITPEKLDIVRQLKEIADRRGQSMAQLALQWVLRDSVVTSALIGASRPEQLVENAKALSFPALSQEELAQIEAILDSNV